MAHFHFHFNSLCGTFFGGTLTLSHSTLSFIFHFHFHFVEQHRAAVAEQSEWHWFYSIIVLCWTCAIAKISSDDFVCVSAIETKKKKTQPEKYVKNVKTKVKGSERFVLENFKLSIVALNKKVDEKYNFISPQEVFIDPNSKFVCLTQTTINHSMHIQCVFKPFMLHLVHRFDSLHVLDYSPTDTYRPRQEKITEKETRWK